MPQCHENIKGFYGRKQSRVGFRIPFPIPDQPLPGTPTGARSSNGLAGI
jgi:hypothetical protein